MSDTNNRYAYVDDLVAVHDTQNDLYATFLFPTSGKVAAKVLNRPEGDAFRDSYLVSISGMPWLKEAEVRYEIENNSDDILRQRELFTSITGLDNDSLAELYSNILN